MEGEWIHVEEGGVAKGSTRRSEELTVRREDKDIRTGIEGAPSRLRVVAHDDDVDTFPRFLIPSVEVCRHAQHQQREDARGFSRVVLAPSSSLLMATSSPLLD